MNKNLHRIIFNAARGLLMATAESAASHSRGDARPRRPAAAGSRAPTPSFRLAPGALAVFMTLSSTLGAINPAQAQIVTDPNAPQNQRPNLTTAANGVPLINITTPSAGGVSRNTYSQFDVQQNGVILNNARTAAATQLGGWIQGNPNLAGGTARIILNEVNSTNPSLLRGYVEVGGDRAQVIIANPAGVTCDGCGFINATRATLTTGTPTFTNGALDGFRVERGQIVVQGNGLDATQTDYTDLIARSIQINAGLWANTLKLVAGSNQVTVDAGSATPIAGTGTAPALAIDVAQLGGMYAGKITLVGTEAGVGVRNAGQIGASAGEVAITVDGQLTNRGLITAQGAVSVTATALDNQGAQIQATGDLTVALGAGQLDNTGGLLRSNQTLNVSAATLTNRSTQGADQGLEGQAVSLTADQIANADGAIRADLGLDIVSGGALDNSRGLIAGQTVQILDPNRAVAASKTLAITNTAGTLFADRNLSIDAASLTGDGNLYALNDLGLWLNSDFSHAGQIIADHDATLFTTGRFTNSGDLQAGNALSLTAAALDNQAAGEIAAWNTALSLTGTLTNRGLIDGSTTTLTAGTVDNLGSGRIYGDLLAIAATTLNNTHDNGASPTLAARSRLDLGVGNLTNGAGALIFSAGELAIGGSLDANRQASGRAGTITNAGGTLQAQGNLAVTADTLLNTNPDYSATAVASGSPLSRTTYVTSQGSFTADQIASYSDAGVWGPLLSGNGNPNPAANSTISFVLEPTVPNPAGGTGGSTGALTVYNFLAESYQPLVAQVLTSTPGQILSGGTMTLDLGTALTNDKSRIIAGGALNILGQSIGNIAATVTASETHGGTNYSWGYAGHDGKSTGHHCDCDFYAFKPGAYAATIPLTLDAGITATLDHQAPGGGASLPTRTTASPPGTLAAPVIPDSSLYQVNPGSNGRPLVETDPRFADYRTWLSSDYLLGQLGLDPTVAQKRLGDGFYEQQQVREQIAQLTGRRFLEGYASDEQEYRALMEAGLTVARQWDLIPGVALTAAQIAQLTSDLVWLVEQTVTLPDGTTQQVLVPQVYLLPRVGDLNADGTLLAGQTVTIRTTGDFTNSGTVAGRTLLDLSAANLHNLGGRLTGQAVNLRATNDITNRGGRIDARDSLALNAGRDIVVETTTADGTGQTGTGNFSRTQIDRVAGLYVTGAAGTLSAIAGRDLTLTAAEIENAGPTTTLQAGRDLTLATVTTRDVIAIETDSRNHVRVNASSEVGTQLRTQGDATLVAGANLSGRAVDLQARGDLTLAAGNDLTLAAGRNEQSVDIASYASGKSGGGLTKKTVTRDLQIQAETSTAIDNKLAGQNINILAGQDLALEGGRFAASDTLALNAGRNLTVAAGESSTTQRQRLMVAQKESLLPGRQSLKTTREESAVTPKVAQLSAKTVTLQAGQDLTLVAPSIAADTLSGTAGGQLTVAAATETHELKETSEFKSNRMNFSEAMAPVTGGNLVKNIFAPTGKSMVTGGRIKDKIKLKQSDSERQAIVAKLAANAIALNSGRDTTLVAPHIQADSLAITAGQNDPDAKIQFLGVKESSTTSASKNSHSFVHETVRDGGQSAETLVLPDIQPGEGSAATVTQLALAAPGGIVVGATSLAPTQKEQAQAGSGSGSPPAGTPVDLKAQAATLAQQPGLAWLGEVAKRDDVDWQKIELATQNWDYKRAGLTQEGAIVVAIVVTILTWGAASEAGAAIVQGAGASTAAGSAGAAVAAGIAAGLSTLASQAAVSLINNQGDVGKTLQDLGSKESVKSLVTSMLTAGALQAVGGTSWMQQFSGTGITDKVVTGMANSAIRATISTAIQGGSYADNLTRSLLVGAVDGLSAYGAGQIGETFTAGSIEHTVAHALLGCASAAATSHDCQSGAIGAAVGEYFAEQVALSGLSDQQIVGLSKLIAATTVMVTGGDPEVAANAAQNAVVNNTLSAQAVRRAAMASGGDPKTAQLLLDLANRENRQKIFDCATTRTCAGIIDEISGGMAELDRQSIANGGTLDAQTIAQAYRLAALDLQLAYKQGEKQQNIDLQKQALSAMLGLAPLVGNVKSVIEAGSGKDYITNSDLSTLERVFAGVGVILPAAGKGLKEAYLLTTVGEETVAVALKAATIDDALKAAAAGTTAANRVATATVRETGILVAAKTTEEITLINTIVKEGDQAGILTERLTESVFKRSGYQSIDPDLLKYSGNKGIDNVFIKGDTVVVVESKQLSSGGMSLAQGNLEGTGLQPQMTVEWVKQVAGKLLDSNDPAKIAVANQILSAAGTGKLQLAASAVNKGSGQLVVVPLKR